MWTNMRNNSGKAAISHDTNTCWCQNAFHIVSSETQTDIILMGLYEWQRQGDCVVIVVPKTLEDFTLYAHISIDVFERKN